MELYLKSYKILSEKEKKRKRPASRRAAGPARERPSCPAQTGLTTRRRHQGAEPPRRRCRRRRRATPSREARMGASDAAGGGLRGSSGAASLWSPERRRRRADAAAGPSGRRRRLRRETGVPARDFRRGGRGRGGEHRRVRRSVRGAPEQRGGVPAAAATRSVARGERWGRGGLRTVLHGGPWFFRICVSVLGGGFLRICCAKIRAKGGYRLEPGLPAGHRATWRRAIGAEPACTVDATVPLPVGDVDASWLSDRAIE